MHWKPISVVCALVCAAFAFATTPAHAAPAATIEICVTDFRVQTNNPRHAIFAYARVRDGRGFQFYVNATDMYGQIYSGTFAPVSAGPGTGYVAGAEPELVRFIERAARDGAWLKVTLDASSSVMQKASLVGRVFPQTGTCGT